MTQFTNFAFPALTGLTLEAAQALLAAHGVNEQNIVIEKTQPPRTDNLGGAWRVLRFCIKPAGDCNAPRCELVVAREQTCQAYARPRAATSDISL